MEGKRVLVASRHSIVRHGLAMLLKAATPHVALEDGRSLKHAVSMIETHRPDLLIAELHGEDDGLRELMSAARAARTRPRVLLLWSASDGEGRMPETAEMGACIVSSRDDAISILSAIDRALEGACCDEAAGWQPSPAGESIASLTIAVRLTPREQQVVDMVAKGWCNKEIARALDISVTTVRTHRQKLMAKLGLRNAVEIANFAATGQGSRPYQETPCADPAASAPERAGKAQGKL